MANRVRDPRAFTRWLGLTRPARQVAVFVLVAVVLADLLLLALDYRQHGLRGIAGGYYIVDFWDVAKAIGIGAALLVAAHRGKSRAITVLAVVFLLLAIEDLITLHGVVGYVLRALSGGLVSRQLGELIAFGGFGFLVFVLVWGGNQLENPRLRRARLVVFSLLVALFIFTGVVDFFADDTIPGVSPLSLVEESGERLVLTLTSAYAAGLAAIQDW